jgi:hypothetical protein
LYYNTTSSKSIESFRKVFWKWKKEVKQASQNPKSIADLDLDFGNYWIFTRLLEQTKNNFTLEREA